MALTRKDNLWVLVLGLGLCWAVLDTLFVWGLALERSNGSDFASYFWAWHAAQEGMDPYQTANLGWLSREAGGVRGVHPFFYPPPFLLSMSWLGELTVTQAYRIWFWVDVAATVACAGMLAAWWRGLDRRLAFLAWLGFLWMTAVPNNHAMGQVNLPVLALVIAGLWAEDRRYSTAGGVLLGLACMAKMSPAFLVAWWLLRRRFHAVAVACATAVVLSLLALWVVPAETQWRFYTEVLPGFGSGDYNGLRVPIGMFGNHSIPNVFHALFPSADGALSMTARRLTTAVLFGTLAVMAAAFWKRPADAWARYGQIATVCTALLLVPVYTYEHHLVYAIPAAVILIGAAMAKRLPGWTLAIWIVALVALAFELGTLKSLSRMAPNGLDVVLQELKFASLLVLFVGGLLLGRSRPSGQEEQGMRDKRRIHAG